MSSRKSYTKNLRRLGAVAALCAFALALVPDARSDEAADAVAYAKKVVEAGLLSKMSRSPLEEGGVIWTGADSSPPPVEGVTVAVMPCPMAFVVCKYLFDKAKDAAEAIGWEAFPIDTKGDPANRSKGCGRRDQQRREMRPHAGQSCS